MSKILYYKLIHQLQKLKTTFTVIIKLKTVFILLELWNTFIWHMIYCILIKITSILRYFTDISYFIGIINITIQKIFTMCSVSLLITKEDFGHEVHSPSGFHHSLMSLMVISGRWLWCSIAQRRQYLWKQI